MSIFLDHKALIKLANLIPRMTGIRALIQFILMCECIYDIWIASTKRNVEYCFSVKPFADFFPCCTSVGAFSKSTQFLAKGK